MPPDDNLLTYADVCERLSLSLRTVKQLVYSGRLAHVRPAPRSIRIRRSDLDAYISRLSEPSVYDESA